MIKYTQQDITSITADAGVLEVDCLGDVAAQFPAAWQAVIPELVAEYQRQFAAGDLEPGRMLFVERNQTPLRYLYAVPALVHPQGTRHGNVIDQAVDHLLHEAIRLGLQSIAIPAFRSSRGLSWADIRLRLLASFARLPDVHLIFCPHPFTPPEQLAKQVTIFTDGGADQNPGPGGYGIVLRFGDHAKELSAGYQQTTNNRMELLAAVVGLEALRTSCHVRLYSDSRYVVDFVNSGALFRALASPSPPKKIKNLDLWRRFAAAYMRHDVEMTWVKGHAGIRDNERCDQLANEARRQPSLLVDEGFRLAPNQKPKQPSGSRTSPLLSEADSGTLASGSEPRRPASRATVDGLPRGPKPKQPGDPCRYCRMPLVRRETTKSKPDSRYYFAWYLVCEQCRRMYHVEAAKVYRR